MGRDDGVSSSRAGPVRCVASVLLGVNILIGPACSISTPEVKVPAFAGGHDRVRALRGSPSRCGRRRALREKMVRDAPLRVRLTMMARLAPRPALAVVDAAVG